MNFFWVKVKVKVNYTQSFQLQLLLSYWKYHWCALISFFKFSVHLCIAVSARTLNFYAPYRIARLLWDRSLGLTSLRWPCDVRYLSALQAMTIWQSGSQWATAYIKAMLLRGCSCSSSSEWHRIITTSRSCRNRQQAFPVAPQYLVSTVKIFSKFNCICLTKVSYIPVNYSLLYIQQVVCSTVGLLYFL